MAICVMPVVAEVPCQCFTPGAIRTTSPGLISCFAPPHSCTPPSPGVTIRICPTGWVSQPERAPGSNVTCPPETRDGSTAPNRGSTRTEPVKDWAEPLADGCEP